MEDKSSSNNILRALLNRNNAIQHLYHFCDTLPADEFIDRRPEFVCTEDDRKDIKARVTLPPCVNAKYRYADSVLAWQTESAAMRDASFVACINLYYGGLINDSLLPLMRHKSLEKDPEDDIESESSDLEVFGQFNPWVAVARAWTDPKITVHKYTLDLESDGSKIISMEMILPADLKDLKPITLYWDATNIMEVTISKTAENSIVTTAELNKSHIDTQIILKSAYEYRFPIRQDPLTAIFSPKPPVWSNFLEAPGLTFTTELIPLDPLESASLVVRDTLDKNRPKIFDKYLTDKPAAVQVRDPHKNYMSLPEQVPYLSLKRISKRSDFLHSIPPGNQVSTSDKAFEYAIPASDCEVDNITFGMIQFALVFPSILHRIQVYIVANTLATTLLRDVAFNNLDLITTAISAPVAREKDNYQRLEFLGDSVLKMCTTVQLLKDHPPWHEGYLSQQRSRFVCNARLSRAAREIGLDKFILTKPFTGDKWRPLYNSDLLSTSEVSGKRKLSIKVLADVVEALLGAAMVEGDLDKVLKCLKTFIPEVRWMPVETNREAIFNPLLEVELPPRLAPLEQLIGYTFRKKSLLIEAMTHGTDRSAKASYERLEFLGDAVLDHIVTEKIFHHKKQLPVPTMHLLRTTLVNGNFLAFMGMEFKTMREETCQVQNQTTGKPEMVKCVVDVPLWRFMGHASPEITKEQKAIMERFDLARLNIISALEQGDFHPWLKLARLKAPKFLSDIVESLLGAMWVDSGSLDVCESLLEKMKILPYMRRIIQDDVLLVHPKEEFGRLAGSEGVDYDVKVDNIRRGKARCDLYLGQRLVGMSEGDTVALGPGWKELLKGAAAEEAVKLLRSEKGL